MKNEMVVLNGGKLLINDKAFPVYRMSKRLYQFEQRYREWAHWDYWFAGDYKTLEVVIELKDDDKTFHKSCSYEKFNCKISQTDSDYELSLTGCHLLSYNNGMGQGPTTIKLCMDHAIFVKITSQFKYTKNELIELKGHADKLRENTRTPLTDELLENLKRHYFNAVNGWNRDSNYIFERPCISACGCMGPRGGDLLCSCSMSSAIYEYRFDVALAVLKQLETNV